MEPSLTWHLLDYSKKLETKKIMYILKDQNRSETDIAYF